MTDEMAAITDDGTWAEGANDLRLWSTRALRGANVWHGSPVMLTELRVGALARRSPADLPGLLARVADLLAELGIRPQQDDVPDWGQLLLLMTQALMRHVGEQASFGRVVASDAAEGRWTLAFGYDGEEVGIDAVRGAARILRDCIRGDDAGVPALVAELAARRASERLDATSQLLVDAARRRGIPVRAGNEPGVIQLGLGAARRLIAGALTDVASGLATDVSNDRERTWQRLNRVGVRSPLDLSHDERASIALAPSHHILVLDGVVISAVALLSGEAVDCTTQLHAETRAVCALAAGAVGLALAELGVSAADVGVALRDSGMMVLSVSASPDLARHSAAPRATARDVSGVLLDRLYPPGAPTTIPVIAVTGTNGKTTTTRLIAHLFRTSGRRVGFTTTDGVYMQEDLLLSGDLTGPFAANVVLSHPGADVAVLETARGGILKSGLGFAECDVGVVTNVTSDHLGLRGIDTIEQLAEVKAVIPSVVREGGHTVLNADDPLVYAMRERTAGRIVLFSMAGVGENAAVEEHMAHGGIVARVEREETGPHFVIREGEHRVVLAAVADVPLTLGGLARFQVENVLAAVAAGYAQGLSPEVLRAGLMSFIPSAARTPGRLNVMETTRGRVVIDYAHNAAAVTALMDLVLAMPANKRIALLSAPGDRRDEDLRGLGALASGLDLVIFKEHEVYRRGREPGAINAIMRDGLLGAGYPADRILTFVEEHEGVAHVMDVMAPGDVVVIVADDTAAVRRQLAPITLEPPR